jgi:hypothetical protein
MECSYTLQAVVGNFLLTNMSEVVLNPVPRKKRRGIRTYSVQEIRVQNNLLLFLETMVRCAVYGGGGDCRLQYA